MRSAETGRLGEDAACELLTRLGYRILERNRVVDGVEVDVIALEPGRRGDTVAFCEVKTRSTTEFGLPSEFLGPEQRARLRRAAGAWMRRHARRVRGARCRLDLVEIVVTETEVRGRVLKDAF